ncbi:hypothetical protein PQS31_15740 [Luteimonas sp BLCC-B24]|uniref:hypothetical protein n=1 Tax=Luteimonas sp. BLCC-B24 TaxID=3025317 RepID=UPI00234D62AD|nr:hypothetical protein [Luteimonas sp. BLCC-B24]MDC7808268.1 hypothetical protein [Luteimonas sp. BLCC-B24]
MRPIRLLTAALLTTAFALAACTGAKDAELALIAAPATGDVYAAELSEFSGYGFTDDAGKTIEPAYGLLKVVAVDGDDVVVITESSAVDDKAPSRQALRGDLAAVAFDDSEEIPLSGAQLREAYDAGHIYAVRRPTAP